MLQETDIKEAAAMGTSYTKGCQYYKNGSVAGLWCDSEGNNFKAVVQGRQRYLVTIEFNEEQEIDYYECTCPAYDNYYGACKHIIAALKAIQVRWAEFFAQSPTVHLSNSTKALLDFFSADSGMLPKGEISTKISLVPTYCISLLTGRKRSWLEFTIGNDKLYVLKDVRGFLEAMLNGEELVFGKKFVYKPSEAVFDDRSKSILKLLMAAYKDEIQFSNWDYYSSYNSAFFEGKKFKLSDTYLLKFLKIMGEDLFAATINNSNRLDVKIVKGRPPIHLNIQGINEGLSIKLDLDSDVYYGIDVSFKYIYHKGLIYEVDQAFSKYIRPLMACFSETRNAEIRIPVNEASQIFSTVLPALEKIAVVNVDTSLSQKYYREQLEKQIYFDRFGDGISARVEFKYGEVVLNPAEERNKVVSDTDGKLLLRSVFEENKVVNLLKRYGFQPLLGVYRQEDEEATYDFLKEGLPELVEQAEVFYSDDFKKIKIKNSGRVSAGVRLNTGTDMLEMSLQFEGMEPRELIELLSAYKLKKRYHRMKDGGFMPLDSSEFQSVAELVEHLAISKADIKKQLIEIPRYRALYIDSLAKKMAELRIERNSSFKKMVQDIQEPEDMEYKIPEGIKGRLRDYQKTGFKWLKVLAHYGLGGILADDMGLGKTLQVLTFLLSEKGENKRASLVIAPTSLVYNWQEEVQKFAPELKVTVVSGQQGVRLEQLKELKTSDLVVTSYALIKRDLKLYESTEFKYCFLDEAQHIKNPATLNAKAVKSIKAKGYFALTGTPVENTLTELWSIFDFLMPGYLQTHKKFTTRYEMPIVKNGDQKALEDLGRQIKPFILRRMKKEVLKELPEKVESKMSNEMTAEQSKVYAAYLLKAKKQFEDELLANGFEKSQIKILALLTRLRQICCHPSLFIENYEGGSGKLDTLMELVEGAVEGGHRLLLFSQFTGMLSLIKNKLNSLNIQYHYLDGSIKAEDRIKLVNSFNAGEKDVFLISLKAGGTGLNLTGADMVIHYDPWWNPAVEDQATDRAYRIGQKNSVQVIKLITKGTIEEKIYELQQRKKELIDAVIKPGENFLTKMNEAEIRRLFDV